MHEIFYPCSVAVIGVSAKATNLGRNIVANLVEYGFDGIVYAVGPSGGMIETRRIYRSVGDIPDHVDLAVILTPAQTVPGVLEECGQKGIRWAIIESAGFREFTEEGRQLEEEIARVAEKYGVRFVGPNCLGAINMENGFCVPFPRLHKVVKDGNVSIITQSGGVGLSALNIMANEGLGLNKFVSVGNMLNINAEDMLEYLITDEGTGLIFLYLESIQDGRRLMKIARGSTKPILTFKANIGKYGQDIALSHTASLASDDRVVDAAFHQAGMVRVRDATTFGNNLKILGLPGMKGKRLGVISRSGGHAVMAADACELAGFELAHFPNEFLREIEKHFRASVIRLTNPLDLGDLFDLELYAQIVEKTLKLEDVDGVVFLHTSLSGTEDRISRTLLERIMEMVKKFDKPVAYYISAAAQEVNYLKQNYNYPIFTQVVETIRALEMSHYYYRQVKQIHDTAEIPTFRVDQNAVRSIIERAQGEKRSLLLPEALEALEIYGIPAARSALASSVEEASAAADEMGYPVAIKIIADQISHKSDVGGVQLNLRNREAVAAAFKDMMTRIHKAYPEAKIDGVLVQPMATGGRELILGGRQDVQFGAVVLVGLGGIFVEILEEVALRVAPITRREAWEMIEELRGYKILKGTRGDRPSDIEAVVEALLRTSHLLQDFPEIEELDINPLRVFHEEEGCLALDARIVLR
ncbi:MAG TPA: acetate--CoA ligase family protein [Anaerolineales bacterium]|nr:acetate--CoA ligase family protein [Anaerolineales bacterium]